MFYRDSATTTMFMLSSTFGESLVPVCIGIFISTCGALSLSYITVACSFMLCLLYIGIHSIGGVNNLKPTINTITKGDTTENVLHTNSDSISKDDSTAEVNNSNNASVEIEMTSMV